MNDKWLLGLAAAIVAIVLLGQAVTYWAVPYNYNAEAEVSDGNIVFSLSSPSSEFSMLAYDAGDFEPMSVLYVFIDPGYSSGQSVSEQNTFLGQIGKELGIRGFPDPIAVDAAELAELMSEPGSGKGILMMSGAFPDTIYSGNADDPIFIWLENKGSIFWMNGMFGHSVSHADGTTTDLENTDMLFFGKEDAVRTSGGSPIGKENGRDRDIGEMLSVGLWVRAGDVTNGLNCDIGGKTLSIGFSDEDGYGSITLTDRGEGKGMIVVFGGGLNGDTRVSLAQIVASGISYNFNADEAGFLTGVVNGTYDGTIEMAEKYTDTFIFFGKVNTVYGTHIRLAEET